MEVRENLHQRMEVTVGPERAVEREEFEQVLEAKVAEMDVTELKHENVQALVEKGMLKAVRETKVKFVLCADSGLGKLHIRKNGTTCWCGRQWSHSVSDECQEVTSVENVCVRWPQAGLAETWCWKLETTGYPKLVLTAMGQDAHGAQKLMRGLGVPFCHVPRWPWSVPSGLGLGVSPAVGHVAQGPEEGVGQVVQGAKRARGWGVLNCVQVFAEGLVVGVSPAAVGVAWERNVGRIGGGVPHFSPRKPDFSG